MSVTDVCQGRESIIDQVEAPADQVGFGDDLAHLLSISRSVMDESIHQTQSTMPSVAVMAGAAVEDSLLQPSPSKHSTSLKRILTQNSNI